MNSENTNRSFRILLYLESYLVFLCGLKVLSGISNLFQVLMLVGTTIHKI